MDRDPIERKPGATLSIELVSDKRPLADDAVAGGDGPTTACPEMTPLIHQYRGRVVSTDSGNVLAEFTHAWDAMRCAAKLQQALKARNTYLPAERRSELRIDVQLDNVDRKMGTSARAAEALAESEERFRALFEQAADSIILLDAETGSVIEFNDQACEHLGYTRDEFQHLALTDFEVNESPRNIARHIETILREGSDIFETKHRTKQGEIRDVLVNSKLLSIGCKKYIQSILRDITEQKHAQEALRRSTERYRDLFTYAPISIWEQDFSAVPRWFDELRADGVVDLAAYFEKYPEALHKALRLLKIRDINDKTLASFKAKNREELLQGIETIFTPETYQAFGRELQRIWNGEHYSEFEFTARTLEGHRFDGLLRWSAPQVAGRIDLSRLVIAILDITEQRQAQAALRRSEERFRSLFEQAADSIILLDAETGSVIEFNDQACEHLGYTRDEFQHLALTDFEVNESPRNIARHIETILREGSDIFETKHRTKQGEIRDILVSARALSLPGKKLLSSIWRDITEQKRSQEALRESGERYRRLVERMNSGMAVVDENFVLTYANDKLCEMGGYAREELIGRPAIEFVGESFRTSFREQMARRRAGARESVEATFIRADGRKLVVMQSAEPLLDSSGRFRGSFAVMTDITEQKRVQKELREDRDELELRVEASLEQLRRSERLASIGTLASGIAHEINNPLGMIQLVAETALGATRDPERVEEMLGQIISDVTRCSHIVKSVLRFAKEQPTEKWTNDLNDIVRHSLDLTREYATRHGANLVEQLCKDLPPILANPTELELVFVNLISNAVNACEPGGSVRLETEKAGARVRAIVRDDGCGMAKEHVERAFEPFYTTRLEQGGTGLGLSTCHGIVAEHGGTIEIESGERQGTSIIVEFPIADNRDGGVPV